MRKYEIFKIKSNYQSFVFGRERLLFELLVQKTDSHYNKIIYLCDQLNERELHELICEKLAVRFNEVDCWHNECRLTHLMKGEVFIKTTAYTIEVYCKGSRMLDLDLFAALSSASDRFFAVMEEHEECGWLKPVKYSERLVLEESLQ